MDIVAKVMAADFNNISLYVNSVIANSSKIGTL